MGQDSSGVLVEQLVDARLRVLGRAVVLQRAVVGVQRLPVGIVDVEVCWGCRCRARRSTASARTGRLLVLGGFAAEGFGRFLADVVVELVRLDVQLAQDLVAVEVVRGERPERVVARAVRLEGQLADLLGEVVAVGLRLPAGEAEPVGVRVARDVEQLLLEREVGPGVLEGRVGDAGRFGKRAVLCLQLGPVGACHTPRGVGFVSHGRGALHLGVLYGALTRDAPRLHRRFAFAQRLAKAL